jgi:hypothetical protein
MQPSGFHSPIKTEDAPKANLPKVPKMESTADYWVKKQKYFDENPIEEGYEYEPSGFHEPVQTENLPVYEPSVPHSPI